MADADFRARLGVSLTEALIELGAQRAARAQLTGVASADFRTRLGVSLTDALIELQPRRAAQRSPSLRERARPAMGFAVRFRRPIAVGVAVLTVGGAGAAASSLWLSPAGNPLYGFNPGLTATAPPAAQLAALAVLRRAQTPSDRGPGVQAALTDVNNYTSGIRSNFVRVLAMTADGPVVLVPVEMRTAQPVIRDALCLYYPIGGQSPATSQVACWSTQQLSSGQAFGSGGGHEYGLVPDGTSAATVTLGTWSRTVAVSNNLFDATLPPAHPGGLPGLPSVTLSRS